MSCAASLIPGWRRAPAIAPVDDQAWVVNVSNVYEVQQECGLGFLFLGGVLGCADPTTRTIWTINNPAVLWHECEHARAFEEGASEAVEWIKDIGYGWMLANGLFALTLPLPAKSTPRCD